MTLVVFLTLLFSFSIATSLIVEVIKKMKDKENFSANLLAVIVGCAIGIGGAIVFYILKDINIGTKEIAYAILLGIANSCCAMVGYDKVKQTIMQITTHEEQKEEEK